MTVSRSAKVSKGTREEEALRSLFQGMGHLNPPTSEDDVYDVVSKTLSDLSRDPSRMSNIRGLFIRGINRNVGILRKAKNQQGLKIFRQTCDQLEKRAPRALQRNTQFTCMISDFRQMINGTWVSGEDTQAAPPSCITGPDLATATA